MTCETPSEQGLDREALARLAAHRERFLAFVSPRVDSPERAEEILQEAYVRGLERGSSLREGESAVAWFYRLLRNALVDHYRRRGAERRALDSVAREPTAEVPAPDAELLEVVCGCVEGLLDELRPAYAGAIRAVDLEEWPVQRYAASEGITPNAASVRLHRARRALARELERACRTCATHGCLDCTCARAELTAPAAAATSG